jgi:hypothetical protein
MDLIRGLGWAGQLPKKVLVKWYMKSRIGTMFKAAWRTFTFTLMIRPAAGHTQPSVQWQPGAQTAEGT